MFVRCLVSVLILTWATMAQSNDQQRDSFEEARKAAKAGDVVSEGRVGYCYWLGLGVKQDYAEAARWYRKAADHGSPNAQAALALTYELGQGFPKATPKPSAGLSRPPTKAMALHYCTLARRIGARVFSKTMARRLDAISRRQKMGYAEAQFALGSMYFLGEGFPQDFEGSGAVGIAGLPTKVRPPQRSASV